MRILALLLLFLVSLVPARAAGGNEADAKIETLINHVAQITTAKFIRNGTEYDSKSAAKFLRAKWQKQQAKIHTPTEFIEKVASRSSTSGKPYQIRFEDGKVVECGPYLKDQLKKLEAPPRKP